MNNAIESIDNRLDQMEEDFMSLKTGVLKQPI